MGLSNFVTFLVSGTNFFITKMNINLIGGIGYHTRSQVTTGIMTSIAYASIINTGLLTLLTNADFSYIFPHIPLQMQYSDMDTAWYLIIGTAMAKTVFIASGMPWALLFASYCEWKTYQWMDYFSAIKADREE